MWPQSKGGANMYLFMIRCCVNAATKEKYLEWAKSFIQRTLEIPGVKEFRAYRTVVGGSEVMIMYEFEDMTTFAAWQDQCFDMIHEGYDLCHDVSSELWGPESMVGGKPIRP
jgi:heme-degrading monooxygenase HmoA